MRYVVCAVLLLMLASCGGSVFTNPVPLTDPQMQAPPTQKTDYRIGVSDELEIKFLYNPELNEKIPVRPDGKISLQMVNEVSVLGLTPLELREQLMDKYGAELKKPEITVIVRSFTAQKIFVDGEVGRGGTVMPIIGPMTVLQAVTTAGGFRETARRNEVVLIRMGTEGKPVGTVLNLERVLDGSDFSQDIYLKPYDIVFVPKSPIANVNTWVDQYIRRLLPFPVPSPIPQPTSSSSSWW